MIGERSAPGDVQVPGEPGDPAEHLQRLRVQVRPLGPPGGNEVIHLVVQQWLWQDPGTRVRIGRGVGFGHGVRRGGLTGTLAHY